MSEAPYRRARSTQRFGIFARTEHNNFGKQQMELHGQAMLDYLKGEEDAYCILRRDDGIAYPPIYARQFFYPDGLPELDRIAVERCTGRVLDIGAGAGSHSLAIQDKGLDVTSIDISRKSSKGHVRTRLPRCQSWRCVRFLL